MRPFLLPACLMVACLILPAAALAQTPAPAGTTTQGDPPQALPTTTPAPVPAITPPLPRTGPASVPEKVAPAGVGSGQSGPANATPFSSTPSNGMPGATPDPSH